MLGLGLVLGSVFVLGNSVMVRFSVRDEFKG